MERLTVELLRMFIRLSQDRFVCPAGAAHVSDGLGWRRGESEALQWLIRPAAWREIFEPHNVDAVEAARTLYDLGLLHGQANDTLQCVVRVGRPPKSERAYVINGHALAIWRPAQPQDYRSYRGAGAWRQESDMAALLSPPSGPSANAAPSSLSELLERGVALALQKGMEVLSMSLDPSDRQSAALLRSQTAFAGHLINAQVRVDETRMRQKKADAVERISRLLEEERERQRRLGY
jgi:hypothetical protein